MRTTPLAVLALVSPVLLLATGCASSFDLYVEETEELGTYRTWDWLPDAARTIDAPTPYVVGLDRDLAKRVEQEMSRRGFRRVARGADLRLGALLNVRREQVHVQETRAIEQLASHHASPNFEVQAMVMRVEIYERYRLVVFAIEPRSGRIVWKGALEERFPNADPSPGVQETVAGLLAHFPPVGDGSGAPAVLAEGEAPATEVTATPPGPGEPDA